MERYTKPSIEAINVEVADSLLIGFSNGKGNGSWHAPKQQDITSSSLTQPDLWKEEERSDMDYYMEAYEK